MNHLKLNRVLARNSNADPADVLHAKSFLSEKGFYEPPEWGLSQFPDRALFDAVRAFQRANN